MRIIKRILSVAIISVTLFPMFHSANSQNRNEKILVRLAEQITKDKLTHRTKSPAGVTIISANKVSDEMLGAIDKGFADLFEIAAKHGFTVRLKHSDYIVFVGKADRTIDANNAYSPDIAVPSGQYKDSEYDKGGFIFAAGMVLAYTPCAFIIADHEKDFERAADVVRFEGEHLVLYHNDKALFDKTADHSKGGGHPILNP